MNLRPVGNNLVITREKEKPKGVIALPEGAEGDSVYAKVVARGPKASDAIQTGDTVVVSLYAGHETTFERGGEFFTFTIIPEDKVLAVIGK